MGTIARRLLQLVVVVVLSTLFAFVLLRLFPGDAADAVLPYGTKAQKAQFRADNGLDKPFLEQYASWLGNLVQGDFGKDYQSNTPVADKLQTALPVSLQLMLYAQLIALVIAIPLGVFTAYRAGTKSDRSINAGAFALLALPSFVLALALAYWVGAKWQPDLPVLGQIPVSGYEPGWLEAVFGAPTGNLADHFATMLLPAISLAAGLIAVYMRLLRSDMIATLQENYIIMARSKGLSDKRILWRHALRPSSLTLLTVAGLNFGTLIGGAVAVEVIFQIPGIGTLIYQAINARQIVELQSYIAIIAIGYVLINFTIDALYVVLDPRIRRARAEQPTGDPMRGLVGEAVQGTPVDAGTIAIAAVETGPEVSRRRKRKGLGFAAWLSIGWMALVVGLAILAPVLPIDDPRAITTEIARRGPLADAGTAPGRLLGGDFNGRDMLSRLIWGGRTTMLVATLAVIIGFVFGGTLGLLGGYFRGKVDTVVSLLLDVFLAIPAVILALALVTILRTQPGTQGGGLDPEVALILALGFVSIPVLGRITRASTLSWSEREFVLAARAQGAKHRRIIWREVLPNVLPAMLSIALLGIAVAIVAEGTLAILGASVETDTPTWGNMIAIGRTALQRAPHIVFEPALMIFFTVLALNMLGDVVRSKFDVREGGL